MFHRARLIGVCLCASRDSVHTGILGELHEKREAMMHVFTRPQNGAKTFSPAAEDRSVTQVAKNVLNGISH